MIAVCECKFLGVTSRKNDRGDYYMMDIYDTEEGGSIRLYCNEDSYNKGMLIPWGQVVNVSLTVGSYSGRTHVSVQDISE